MDDAGGGVWSLGYAAELATPDLAGEFLWQKVEFAGIVAIPVAWLIFTLRFSRQTGRLNLQAEGAT